jgi:isopenicillin-N N-acyltransferase-like protein
MSINLLELSGSHFEMGYQHGLKHNQAIRSFAEERIALSSNPLWTGQELSRAEIMALAEACLAEHEAYAPELMEELEGMSHATGVALPDLIVLNGFTDFIDTVHNAKPSPQLASPVGADNCTAFLVPNHRARGGQGFFGQTWDMHASATPFVILLRGTPKDAPAFLVFTITGCVGMIGMNEAGICIGINNLLGADGQVGVTWPFVVRKALMQDNLEDALACITEAKLAGAHNFLLYDSHGQGYNLEAMSTQQHLTVLGDEPIVHTNHCLLPHTKAVERERAPDSQASSTARLQQAERLLARADLDTEDLQALTRDPEAICVRSAPPRHVETCGAAIMRPATGEFWAVHGLPAENDYVRFEL